MSASPSQQEMKRIFEKSIKLLDSSQSQLRDVRSILRKSVTQLTLLNTGKLDHVNEILAAITDSISSDVDVDYLDRKLEQLADVFGRQEYQRANSGNLLQVNIEQVESNQAFLADNDVVRNRLLQLNCQQLSDDELASKVLALLAEVASDAARFEQLGLRQQEAVQLFVNNITEAADLVRHPEKQDVAELLGNLYHDLSPRLLRESNSEPVTAEQTADTDNALNHLFIELINNLSLHDKVKDQRNSLKAELQYPVKDVAKWGDVLTRIDKLVNTSIAELEAEKHALQAYVTRIIDQLAHFEDYVKKSRQESSRAATESIDLSDSVQMGLDQISGAVTDADDLDMLQDTIETRLDSIRKSVIANRKVVEEREFNSVEAYSAIIVELVDTQRESEQLKAQLEDSHTRLLRDHLTGLPNRMAFNERVNVEYHRWMRDKAPLSIAMWDIDHFKAINDNYGHDVGDRVLKIVANIIHSRIRKTDIFARYGGEEFVFLMPDTELEPALMLNNKLREKLAEAGFHYDGEKCEVTSSVGIATFAEGDTVESVMKRADIALYESKDGGRNRCSIAQREDA